jgi:hypothetical protein
MSEIETEDECRTSVSGTVDVKFTDNFAVFDWDDGGLVGLNLYDASDEQRKQIDSLETGGGEVTLKNCGVELRDPYDEDDADYEELQLQVDADVTIAD